MHNSRSKLIYARQYFTPPHLKGKKEGLVDLALNKHYLIQLCYSTIAELSICEISVNRLVNKCITSQVSLLRFQLCYSRHEPEVEIVLFCFFFTLL